MTFYTLPHNTRRKGLSLALTLGLLTGCTTTPPLPPSGDASLSPEIVPPVPLIVDRPFTSDTLYALMVAEFAGERQRFDIMLSNYLQQAEATRDLGVTARAARLARFLSAHEHSLAMALLWLELEPDNPEAHWIAAAELVHSNQLLEALPHSLFLLERDETSGLDAIGARAQQINDPGLSETLLQEYRKLLLQHPRDPALQMGASLLYQHTGDLEQALVHVRAASAIHSHNFQASALETRLLQQLGRHREAQQKMAKLVEMHPDNMQLRLQYARTLLQDDLPSAQAQFERLLADNPDDLDLQLTLALIQQERGLHQDAKPRFEALTASGKHRSTAHYYLGRIAAQQNATTEAIEHFRQVKPSADYLPAQSQLTELMIARGDAEGALAHIRQQQQSLRPEQAEQEGLLLLEAHLLSRKDRSAEALARLHYAIAQFPASTRLLYTRAMLYLRIDELAKAEVDFKDILARAPDHAAALNALGYTLADRTDRLEEAYHYIRAAYALTPEDPAVIDSLGWVQYRRGNLEAALKNLRHAMELMPDHEIAAHLGEVLWMSGQQREALQVWQRGLELKPDSAIIRATMERLRAAQ